MTPNRKLARKRYVSGDLVSDVSVNATRLDEVKDRQIGPLPSSNILNVAVTPNAMTLIAPSSRFRDEPPHKSTLRSARHNDDNRSPSDISGDISDCEKVAYRDCNSGIFRKEPERFCDRAGKNRGESSKISNGNVNGKFCTPNKARMVADNICSPRTSRPRPQKGRAEEDSAPVNPVREHRQPNDLLEGSDFLSLNCRNGFGGSLTSAGRSKREENFAHLSRRSLTRPDVAKHGKSQRQNGRCRQSDIECSFTDNDGSVFQFEQDLDDTRDDPSDFQRDRGRLYGSAHGSVSNIKENRVLSSDAKENVDLQIQPETRQTLGCKTSGSTPGSKYRNSNKVSLSKVKMPSKELYDSSKFKSRSKDRDILLKSTVSHIPLFDNDLTKTVDLVGKQEDRRWHRSKSRSPADSWRSSKFKSPRKLTCSSTR